MDPYTVVEVHKQEDIDIYGSTFHMSILWGHVKLRMNMNVCMYVCLLGLCLAKMKKLTMSFDDFDVAIEMEPNNPNHYFSR